MPAMLSPALLSLAALLPLGCALKVAPPPAAPTSAQAVTSRINWDQAGREAAEILSGYIRVPTTHPPGNETAGAQVLGALLEAEGIPYEILESAPGRGNLVARLDSPTDSAGPLCLLSHIDVVTAEPEKWSTDPLSGELRDGMVWGRGALDMKGMGVIELLTLVWLKRLEVPLRRDVVLIAVADEESGNEGAQFLVREHWDKLGCTHLINEGGIGLKDMLFDGQTVYPISVGEKGSLWLKMCARGEPGHGSTPVPNEAPAQLMDALNALEARTVKVTFDDSLYELFSAIGDDRGGLSGFILRRPFLVRTLLRPRLMKNPLTRAGLTNTVHLTGFSGIKEPNVVPAEVYAQLDCRTLPGTTPEAHLAYIQEIVGPDIGLEVISSMGGNVSTWTGDPLYEALVRQVEAAGHVAGPVISVGFTDSIYFRPRGVQAYGFVPFELTEAEMTTFHGNDERLSVDNLRRGLQMLLSAVLEVSAG